ncbi:MAG: glycosyltransferase [Acidobacteriaceae bacterium]
MSDCSYPLSQKSVEFPSVSTSIAGDLLHKALIISGLLALILVNYHLQTFAPIYAAAARHGLGAVLLRPCILWFTVGSTLMAFRTVLWLFYRPPVVATVENALPMTVVIPAYNEGAMVAKAIDSVAGAHYAAEKLQIIVVDDGSTDDTWMHIQHAVARHGRRVEAIRLEQNSGKRKALATAFARGTGDIFVTVDSDSVVDPNSLLALAGPFANERIGVVAGRVLVYNRREGLIPRMLHVRFALSFDFLRACQSTFRTVYCSPGALSAYRASAVREVMPQWVEQSFLGSPATIGEDRALTNDLMRLGYDSVYQRAAMVLTIVPTTYRQLCRMFLRWDRSFVREEIRFARIVWKRPPLFRFIALIDCMISDLRYPAALLTVGLMGAALAIDPLVLPRMLAVIGIVAFIYSLYYLHSERSFDIVYGVLFSYFSFFCLFWIFPCAVVTARAKGWLTR